MISQMVTDAHNWINLFKFRVTTTTSIIDRAAGHIIGKRKGISFVFGTHLIAVYYERQTFSQQTEYQLAE